jgi:hypothetical protein
VELLEETVRRAERLGDQQHRLVCVGVVADEAVALEPQRAQPAARMPDEAADVFSGRVWVRVWVWFWFGGRCRVRVGGRSRVRGRARARVRVRVKVRARARARARAGAGVWAGVWAIARVRGGHRPGGQCRR